MHNDSTKKIIGSVFFLVWSLIVLSAFYITQRPLFIQVIGGTLSTLWAIGLLLWILINSYGIGAFILQKIRLQSTLHESLILQIGLGLGVVGLGGYGLAALGLAKPIVLLALLFANLILVLISKYHSALWLSLISFLRSFKENQNGLPRWLPYIVLLGSALGFGFALLPPAEGFDGLFYHLALPERLLADGKILPYAVPQFWFPGLMEGNFIWALGLGSERTAQLLHWAFSILTIGLVWEWSRNAFNHKSAWWALALLISMPSLAWLSAWAYNDFALVFYELACLYALWKLGETKQNAWLVTSASFAGLAMSLKYTSVILPIFCVALLFFSAGAFSARLRSILVFSIVSIGVASPWYIRNWLIMENPVYPFVFLGRAWDVFQAAAYAGKGSGIGWNLQEILLLPFNITLGHRDQNFFDGRLGPLFLLFLPAAVWGLWKMRSALNPERKPLVLLAVFALINYGSWAFSVVQTSHLWQARLLLPGLIPLAIPMGFGMALLSDLDLPRLRISFISALITGVVIIITIIDNSLLLLVRRPWDYALGIETRERYFERIQPQYTEAAQIVNSLPKNSFVYFLFEPRSYNMLRKVQPDPINSNVLHDYYLYGKPTAIINEWKKVGYTHVLFRASEAEAYTDDNIPDWVAATHQLTQHLVLLRQTKHYKLYSIP